MTATTSSPAVADGHDTVRSSAPGRARLNGRRAVPRMIGALFLLGFVTYGVGFALVDSAIGAPDLLAGVAAHESALVLGVFLMLLNTAVDVGKAVLFFPVLERHGRRTALTYLATMIFEVTLLAVGALSLLSLVPLAHRFETGQVTGDVARTLASLAVDSNEMAYQVAQAGLAFGAVFLCVLLYRVRLVPRFLAGWGVVGYVTHFVGAAAEVFGWHVSMVLLVPGGLFELSLGIWLLVRGFDRVVDVPES
jgi:uncharacterized protein DUF4386